ncbi:hypothetical protein HAPAU_34160 [Halalkalicoccus paucihalophilus]|uniref:Uncharacterized protein n=1 Tax=Halalkalicoccus paucihalophilus TaxID=1008153 RepID=A0A151A9Z8_9EURY|nr:hypothetical protein HAPAU_34160 [Halalkalicoccus paucihalophilus]
MSDAYGMTTSISPRIACFTYERGVSLTGVPACASAVTPTSNRNGPLLVTGLLLLGSPLYCVCVIFCYRIEFSIRCWRSGFGSFFDYLIHSVQDLLWLVFGFDYCFSFFFVNFD